MELIEKMKSEAEQILENSYAPYSSFHVGATLLTEDNSLFSGVNVENMSYGLSVCAERVALFSAISAGKRNFRALAVVSDGCGKLLPCGACLQVLAEFEKDLLIYTRSADTTFRQFALTELLPHTFTFK